MSTLGFPTSTVVLGLQREYVNQQHDVVQRLVDDVVEALASEKRDKPGSVSLLEKYLQTQGQHGMEAAFDYYTQNVLPALPFPKPEQFSDAQRHEERLQPQSQRRPHRIFRRHELCPERRQRGLDKR